jgi:transposase
MKQQRIPNGKYSKEFRLEAVRLVKEEKMSIPQVSKKLSIPQSSIGNWVKAMEEGRLEAIGSSQRPLTEVELELARTRRKLAEITMERDILKKAAALKDVAYFAKESLPGTR